MPPCGPLEFAEALGIEVTAAVGLPFRVGSDGDRIIYCWDPAHQVRDARLWEGIAQCILTRSGIPWSEGWALRLARQLRQLQRRRVACFSS